MKKVIVLGALPIASMVVRLLKTIPDVDLVGVVLCDYTFNIDPFSIEPLGEYARKHGIPIYSYNDVVEKFNHHEIDIAFSCRYSQILKKPVLQKFRMAVNFHGGLLPEFAGLYSSCHTILQRSKIGGGTLHLIEDESIDTGRIIKRIEFLVSPHDTSETIFQRTQLALYMGFEQVVGDLLQGRIPVCSQDNRESEGVTPRYFDRKSLRKQLADDFLNNPDDLLLKVRAYECSGHERAYFVINGQKVWLTTKPFYLYEH